MHPRRATYIVGWVRASIRGAAACVTLVAGIAACGAPAGSAQVPAARLVSLPRSSLIADSPSAGEWTAIAGLGPASLVMDGAFGYWCDRSSCRYDPSLQRWAPHQAVTVAVGSSGGAPVFAAASQLGGARLRLVLGSCARQSCRTVGGGEFTAPGYRRSTVTAPGTAPSPQTSVFAASASGHGFAVIIGDVLASSTILYAVDCASLACHHPSAYRLASVPVTPETVPGQAPVAIAATSGGGFAAAVHTDSTAGFGMTSVYECASARCAAPVVHRLGVPDTGIVALAQTPAGQTLIGYDVAHTSTAGRAGIGTTVEIASCACASAAASFRTLGQIPSRVPVVAGDPVAPAIALTGGRLLVVSSDAAGRHVVVSSCAVLACARTLTSKVVASVRHPLVELGIAGQDGRPRLLWGTRGHGGTDTWQYSLFTCDNVSCR